jgi:hypothetical protein
MAKKEGFTPLLITGLLALMGTIVGGIVQTYVEKQQQNNEFRTNLILKALEPEDPSNRLASLKFLLDANLIKDPKYPGVGLDSLINNINLIPQFSSNNKILLSSEENLLKKYPELHKDSIALIGFKVRFGCVIDGVIPIYAKMVNHKHKYIQLDGCYMGDIVGGNEGIEHILVRENHVVSKIQISYGTYESVEQLAQLKIFWKCLEHGDKPCTGEESSELMGKACDIKGPLKTIYLSVGKDSVITSLYVDTNSHDKRTYIRSLKITSKKCIAKYLDGK